MGSATLGTTHREERTNFWRRLYCPTSKSNVKTQTAVSARESDRIPTNMVCQTNTYASDISRKQDGKPTVNHMPSLSKRRRGLTIAKCVCIYHVEYIQSVATVNKFVFISAYPNSIYSAGWNVSENLFMYCTHGHIRSKRHCQWQRHWIYLLICKWKMYRSFIYIKNASFLFVVCTACVRNYCNWN